MAMADLEWMVVVTVDEVALVETAVAAKVVTEAPPAVAVTAWASAAVVALAEAASAEVATAVACPAMVDVGAVATAVVPAVAVWARAEATGEAEERVASRWGPMAARKVEDAEAVASGAMAGVAVQPVAFVAAAEEAAAEALCARKPHAYCTPHAHPCQRSSPSRSHQTTCDPLHCSRPLCHRCSPHRRRVPPGLRSHHTLAPRAIP